jgi:glycerophosphoryl diester phosphodiesterase
LHPLRDLAARPVFGHRGNRAHAPENTVESFGQAVALGVDGLELDVRLTRDGGLVVLHDQTVDRTTDGRGAVADLTLEAIRALDAGARFTADQGASFPYAGRDIRVPTMAELLEAFPRTPLLIEIKAEEAAGPLRDLLVRTGASGRCVVASFSEETLRPFVGPDFLTAGATSDVARLLLPALLRLPIRSVPFDLLSVPRSHRGIPVPLAALARSLRPLGVPVHAWTINDPRDAIALWRRGVRGIITDDPAAIIAARGTLRADEN